VVIVTLLCAGFGLLLGSFLNVVVARVPAGESVASPPSHCPRCSAPIAPRDNIPVLSWLLLRGRGRCCGEPISVRYPLVEVSTALAFGAVAVWVGRSAGSASWPLHGDRLPTLPAVLALLALLYLVAVSLALALIDIDVQRLPVVIVVPSWWICAALLAGSALLAGNRPAALRTLAGGLLLWVVYRLLHQIHPAGMAYGDVRLAGLIGLYLAWLGWMPLAVGAFAGFLFGSLGGVLVMALRGGGLRTKIPYGPYMLAGTWFGLVWGDALGEAYLRLTGLR